ncbi:MAG: hypothetical protein SF029_13025 [bacterium]|nr:hypothetical protein [bacterium]
MVDAIFDGLEQAVEETPADDVVLFLLDGSLSHLNPPLSYTFQRAKDFMRRHALPPRRRVAVLYTNGLLVSLLDTFLSSLTGYNSDFSITRFFKADQRDEAVQWLLSNRTIQR